MSEKSKQASRKDRIGIASRRLLCGASLAALLSLPSLAHAQDANRYWDANSTAPGAGGAGTWDTTSLRWSTDGNGTGGLYDRPWQNAQLDNAIFAGTAGIVNLSVPITVHNITFDSANYTLTGNTLTLAGSTPTINVSTGTSTISSVIAGTQGLTKAGAGTLSLTGVSTFTGGIVVNGGEISVDSDASLGAASNTVTLNADTVLTAIGALSTSREVDLNGDARISGGGVGSALFTGTGTLSIFRSVTMSNDANTYTGTTITNGFGTAGTVRFTSVRNTGVASSLGASGDIIFRGTNSYTGTGDTSNRTFRIQPSSNASAGLVNSGTGILALTGPIFLEGGPRSPFFSAESADLVLSGTLSGTNTATVSYTGGGTARTITLGGANTYTGANSIGTVTVRVSTLADRGAASSLGTNDNTGAGLADIEINNGVLDYSGDGDSSNRTWEISNNSSVLNNGTGALALTGAVTFDPVASIDTLTLGGSAAGENTISGDITGSGRLVVNGAGTWALSGTNTYTGGITVESGTLRADSASALGATTSVTVNGGTLDLNGNNLSLTSIDGSGGTLALGSANLTVNLGTGVDRTYSGSITGTGSFTKLGAGNLTLTGVSTYTGVTTIGGGILSLDFAATSDGPTDNLISNQSALFMSGGELRVTGGPGETNSQTFDGLTITGGNNIIRATGTAANLTLDLGAITRSAGLANFVLPGAGAITTSNADGALGGWATVNGTDYAKVEGGNIVAFTNTDYVNSDDASTWAANQILSDAGGSADSAYFGTVGSSVQIGGLQYTANADSTVEIDPGATLGIDGTIIVAPSVATGTQLITDGSITGSSGGGVLGVQQNGAGTFEIASQIVDNTGTIGFTKAGAGRVVLSGSNTYTGATTIAQGTLSVSSIENGGTASAVGRSTSDASNLIIQGATLEYTGGTTISDRGFSLARSGSTTSGTISVSDAAANLTFGGQVTSSDGAGLTKIGDGTLTLTNAGNDYTGITRIEAGILATDNLANGGATSGIGAASSDSANLVLLNGSTLQYTGGNVEIDRGFTVESGAGRIDVSAAATTLTVGGVILGSGNLEKYGDGTLVLTGANLHAGTVVQEGILRAGGTDVFGSPTGGMMVNAGGILDLADNNNRIGALNGDGDVTLGSLATTTLTIGGANSTSAGFSGMISGAGNVTHTNGTQVMTGCGNSYTGVTTITGALGGSVLTTDCILDGGENSGIGASGSDASNLVIQNSGILNYTAVATDQVTDRGFTLAAGFGYIQVADAGTVLEFTGDFTGPGALIKRGAGTLVLSGANGSTGETRVEAGVLRSGSATSFTNGRRLLMSNVAGALFDLNGFDATFSALDGGGLLGGNIALGDATLTLLNTETRTYGGTISGSGSLVKAGSQNQGLSGCGSSYTGSTTINSGTLFVSCLTDGLTNSSIGASSNDASNLVLNGGALQYSGTGDSTDRRFTLGGSARINASGTGAVAFTSTAAVTLAGPGARTLTLGGTNTGDNVLAAQLTDADGGGVTSLTKAEAGTWRLSNADSTYTGVTSILGGVLSVDKLADGGLASSIGRSTLDAANLVIGSGSTLRYTGAGDSTNRLFTLQTGVTFIESSGTGAIAFTNTGTMGFQGNGTRIFALGGTNTGVNVMGVSITDGTGGATTVAKNDAGNWYLTGNSTYTGPTNINAGTLFIGNGGTTGSITSNTVNVTGLGALGFDRSDTVTYAGTIQGSGGVTQAGTGTTILTGDNLYSGGTTISAGILQLGNGGATGSILGNVANSGTLAFNRNNSYTFDGTITGTGTIAQIGSGTTTLTAANNAGTTRIGAGTLNVNGALTTQDIAMAGTSTLNVNATMGAFLGGTASLTGDAGASTINVAGGATLRAAGDLGGGSDTVNLTGTLATGGSVLNLGLGDDSLVINDGATIGGARIDGGGGVDDLRVVVNNASSPPTLDSGSVSGFESLTKQGTASLILTGAHDFSDGVVVEAGRLAIGDGTTASSITGDIRNEGTVDFLNSADQTYGGTLTGSGRLQKQFGGTLVLTGNNAYTGNTDVLSGMLIVNGDQSGATGRVTVRSRLGGAGTIGGDVQVNIFGSIAPGSGSGIPGTLTILGDLALNGLSSLEFDFGAAGEVGGDLNDLIVVGGDLTLDGTINVTQPPGGTFGPGVYRIISYGGTLTDGGLNVGSPDHFIQTSIAGQVNLVNSAGLALSFWDGDGGARANGLVDGGSGTWRAAGDQNWTDDTGTFAGPFAAASFAVFQGAAGAVLVDTTSGPVEAMGMQFASDGYVVEGGGIVLADDPGQAGLQSIVRVGDGTEAGANYVATIESVLSGATRLVKTDAGTLVLTGTNLYTGGTAINGGTLQISSNANLGEFTGGLSFDGGTLHVVADVVMIRNIELVGDGTIDADATFVDLRGAISGAGALTKQGNGILALVADSSYTGGTTIAEGILQIGNGGTTGSILGDVVNNGSLLFARSDDVIFGGTISGSGELTQGWTGILTLTADNSYTGGTTISDVLGGGTLQLGNGGTTGSIVGDVDNGGTLIFNRSNEYVFAGTISGSGAVRQAGDGTTILTGSNSYTGLTTVDGGTLLVNGDQSLAMGETDVASGATLGGVGRIGGDVILAGGAFLAPGDASGPGTLTINGSLSLDGTSRLSYEFGASNVVGGPLNDLVDVRGDLTLGGTIDVTVTPGGDFGVGVYRVLSYDGLLGGPGLAVGDMPAGSDVAVQTSVAGQVNLVNTAGLTLNFWDGEAGPKGSAVNGGDGVWQNADGNDNWADITGVFNGAFDDGEFAIFSAATGRVTVDDDPGAVVASGMQFISDGYVITGDALTLSGPDAIVNVGDGTAEGAGYSATIESALVGGTRLVKTGLGTLVLSGSNAYDGGTLIQVGALSISSDANLGAADGAIAFGGGRLVSTADIASGRAVELAVAGTFLPDVGTTLTLDGAITGAGGLTQAGAGTLVLTGANDYEGATTVAAGSLFVNGDQTDAQGLTSVAGGALLGGIGTIGDDVELAGGATLAPGMLGAGTLTIAGALTLSETSRLDFQLGDANVVGGALNDLVEVGGNLVLDGALDVAMTPGGSFGPGIYRLFNYGGALTDNGLELGSMPGGSSVSVQTAVDGQVNLVNTAGLSLTFWDGGAGPKNNDLVDGGSGTWRLGGGSSNWTDSAGAVNADYSQSSFAIFSAA
ncbi:autotransporter-associated beta strand repeat-containing protein, partial [Sphingosinicella sp. CPCC 101087]|uniref:autotransporter-associated beta strand repeat-containing protein n=1 Tax=Sphingosinicella sp. CPCC 101087 TaxID=2497754 RepID=UPI0013EB04DA